MTMQREGSLETTATSNDTGDWEYQCIFCEKIFNTGRALGGHQNAHRFKPRNHKRTHHRRLPKKRQTPRALPPPAPQNIPWYNHYQHVCEMVGQAIQAKASRVGLDLNAMPSDVGGSGGEEVDLELRLYF
ncbi:hypothetical protein Acr_00g0070520 [Actinidia rufa]|uniref:C2H2-type domain-containing protein n=1 Tax=Actinidia rufa TaxID=165716 RepID=A0A7J0DSN5_9ERIC|nr:hypothetical protein Acr_00g0070520 [Actinidia rufa]